jgi:hypothetical protein
MARYPKWDDDERRLLGHAWGKTPVAEIARQLGRSESAIRQEAYKLFGTTLDRAPTRRRRKQPRTRLYDVILVD